MKTWGLSRKSYRFGRNSCHGAVPAEKAAKVTMWQRSLTISLHAGGERPETGRNCWQSSLDGRRAATMLNCLAVPGIAAAF